MVASTMSESEPEQPKPRKASVFALAIAAALVMLRNRQYRRNLLFGLTLAMLIMVFVGAVPLGQSLMQKPMAFTVFWALCFVLLMAVLCLAFYDLMRVRQEHRREKRQLDVRLAEAVEELKAEVDLEKTEAGGQPAGDEDPEPEELLQVGKQHDKAVGDDDSKSDPESNEGEEL